MSVAVPLLLDARVVHLRDVALEVRARLRHLRLALPEGRLRLTDLGEVLGHRGLGLPHRRLERSGIDREQQLASLDVPAFREVDLLDLARDLRLDADGRVRLHVADGVHLDRHDLLLGGGHADRHGRRGRGGLRVARPIRAGAERQRRREECDGRGQALHGFATSTRRVDEGLEPAHHALPVVGGHARQHALQALHL